MGSAKVRGLSSCGVAKPASIAVEPESWRRVYMATAAEQRSKLIALRDLHGGFQGVARRGDASEASWRNGQLDWAERRTASHHAAYQAAGNLSLASDSLNWAYPQEKDQGAKPLGTPSFAERKVGQHHQQVDVA